MIPKKLLITTKPFLMISQSEFCVAVPLDSCDITPPVLSAMSEATPVSIEPWVFPSQQLQIIIFFHYGKCGFGVCLSFSEKLYSHSDACTIVAGVVVLQSIIQTITLGWIMKSLEREHRLLEILNPSFKSGPPFHHYYHWNLLPCHPQLALVSACAFRSNYAA